MNDAFSDNLFSALPVPPTHPIPDPLPQSTAAQMTRCAEVWQCPQILEHVEFQYSTRMTRALAKCLPEQALVRVSQYLLKQGWINYYDEVICHELAHYAVWLKHGREVRPHGREWQSFMREAGYHPRVTLPTPDQAAPIPKKKASRKRPRYQYRYTCPHGHGERWSGRLMRHWRCSICIAEGREGRLDIMRYRRS